MQTQHKLRAKLLSLGLTVAMIMTMLPAAAFAVEEGASTGASPIGTIQSFDQLEGRFIPSVGKDAPDHVNGLSVAQDAPEEDLRLPAELTAMVARTSTVIAPAGEEAAADAGQNEAPAATTVEQETIPVTWQSDKEYQPGENGTFAYTAVLPEGYILADGVELPQIYVAVGKQARASGDSAITVDGNNGYSLDKNGLQKAFDGIVDGGTVKLDGDVDLGASHIAHITAKNITLDLNGHKVSSSSSTAAFLAGNGAGLTISGEAANSKIEYTGPGAAIKNLNGAVNITIESGTIESTNNPNEYTIFINSEGTLTVNGGTITSAKGGVLCNNKGDITVSGSAAITGALTNVNISTINCNNGNLSISGTPVITYPGNSEYIHCIRTNGGTVAISGGNISVANGVAIRAETVTSFSISGSAIITSQSPVATSGTIFTFATVSLSDTAQVLNTTPTGNAIYLASNASYSMTATNVVGKIAPSNAVSGTIKGSDTNNGIAATLQLKHSSGVAIGSEVTAGANGSYTIQVPKGTGYTIDVSMNGYTAGTIAAFDITNSALTGKDLTLTKAAALTTVTINGTPYEGASLQDAVSKLSSGAAAVTSLNITAGEVTTADWDYLENLTAMTTFEIANGVTVANIPADEGGNPKFPSTIQSVIVPQPMTIGSTAFYGCIRLETVNMPAVTSIGYAAFNGCSALTSVNFPAVTSIGQEAFNGCSALTSASFPVATSIAEQAFNRCTTLRSASFPAAESIGNTAFNGCSALTSASFPVATSIGEQAFNSCSALTSASFPVATSIGNTAFSGCTALTTLKLGATAPTTVGTDAFQNCPATRALGYVDASGNALTDTALTTAQAAYKGANDGDTTDGKWYGWTIESATPSLNHNIDTDGSLTLTTDDGCLVGTPHVITGTTTANTVKVTSGTHYVTLDDVSITATTVGGPFQIKAGTVNLTLTGANTLTAQRPSDGEGYAGLLVMVGTELTIDGTGSLTATGYKNSGMSNYGAGIGGNSASATDGTTRHVGTITIHGGTITASGGYGIGPGVAGVHSGTAGALTISGAATVVTATGLVLKAAVASTDLTLTGLVAKYKVDGAYTGATNISGNKIYEGTAQTAQAKDVRIALDGGTVDKTALTNAITTANSAMGGVSVNNNPVSSVASGTRFVTTAEMSALTDAITAAQAVADNSASTADQVSAAITTLNNAVTTFHAAIKIGTYSGGGGSSSGGGGGSSEGGSTGGSAKPKPTEPVTGSSIAGAVVDGDGNATVSVTEKNISDALKAAKDAASKKGVTAGAVTVMLRVTTDGKDVKTATVNLPKSVQEQIIKGSISNVAVVIDNPDISIGMTLATIKEMNRQAGGDIQLSATRMDFAALSAEAKAAIGDRPAFDLTAAYESGAKQVTSFGDGTVTVEIPYTLQNGEVAGGVYAVYVDADGKATAITNSTYDAENRVLRFETNHFSVYGIGYQAPMDFTDITGHWASTDIAFVVGRGLMSGTSATTFAPNDAMTRGMFVTALGRLAGIDTGSYQTGAFTDVSADAYYAPYVNWAADKGIVKGTGETTFAPNQAISRQEMAVILSSCASALGYEVPGTTQAVAFADGASIAGWAADAVKQMQMAGILNGRDGNRFDPAGTATRGEISAMLHRYVALVVDHTAE